MTLSHLFELLLICFALLDVVFIVNSVTGGRIKERDNRWFAIFCLGGAVWAVCFAELFVSESVETAYILRSIGMFGMFVYMIGATFLFTSWSDLPLWLTDIFCGGSISGFIIYPFNIRRDYTVFFMTDYGMSYSYVPDVWVTIFTIYTLFMFVAFVIILLYMMRERNKRRNRKLAAISMMALFAMGVGNVLDTIMPALGFPAFPGTTLTQFAGTGIVFIAVIYANRNRISLESMARHVVSSVKTPLFVLDDRAVLKIVNDEADRLFHIRRRVGTRFLLGELFDCGDITMSQKESVISFEANSNNGDMTFDIELNRIHDEFGEAIGYIVVAYDTTERTRFISQLEAARKAADDANRAKSAFLASMSHEIRTPINTVLGMNEMIRRECDDSVILKYSENIHDSGEALLSIINDILDFSKVEAGMMEIVESEYSTRSLLSGLIGMIKMRADEKGLDFITDIDEKLPCRMYGDEVRIRQILINLLSNATKYTARGSVTFRVTFERSGNSTVTLKCAVEDTGIGIRKEDIGSLFDSFTRLDGNKTHHIEGTGLGLSIVKELVGLMKARIDVQSEYGKGSVFTLIIDQQIVDATPTGKITGLDPSVHTGKYKVSFIAPGARILVVDDNRMNLEVVKGLLKKTRIMLDTAESGMECLEAVKKAKYDVILLDHMMPVMDGIETLHRMKEMSPEENKSIDAKTLALTANALRGMKELYLSEGFDGYLSKPVEADKLEKMMKAWLPSELILSPSADDGEDGKDEKEDLKAGDDVAAILEENGISLKSGLEYCSNVAIYRETAKAFCDTCDEMCDKLTSFRSAGNCADYRILIHGIKSNARTLGCDSLYRFALRQEDNCKAGDFEAVLQDGGIPENMTKQLKAALVKAFGFAAEPMAEEKAKKAISEEEFRSICAHVRELLEDFEATESFEEFSRLKEYDLGEEQNRLVPEVLDKIQVFDYDSAIELIEQMVGKV